MTTRTDLTRPDDKWIIVGRHKCSYCDKAKGLLHSLGIPYVYFPLEFGGPLKEFIVANGLNTVPQVFLNGYLIGGYAELEEYLRPELLQKAQYDLFERREVD